MSYLSKGLIGYNITIAFIFSTMNFATQTRDMVFYRKEHGLTQVEIAQAMGLTQSTVARLEKRLLTGADVTLSALQSYAAAIGLSIEWTLKPIEQRDRMAAKAEDTCAQTVHLSAYDDEDELAKKGLIRTYAGELLAKQKERNRG